MRCYPPQIEQTNYVLLEDGSIWAWHYQFTEDPFAPLVGGLIPGAGIGLIVGVIAFYCITKTKFFSRFETPPGPTSS